MATSQTTITREVKRYMDAERMTQADLAAQLGVTQPRVSSRLRGETTWTLEDLDTLMDIGVPIGLSAYGALAQEEWDPIEGGVMA